MFRSGCCSSSSMPSVFRLRMSARWLCTHYRLKLHLACIDVSRKATTICTFNAHVGGAIASDSCNMRATVF
jgi:hypothetical protein